MASHTLFQWKMEEKMSANIKRGYSKPTARRKSYTIYYVVKKKFMLMNVISKDSFVLKTNYNYFILSIYSVSSYYYIPSGRVKTMPN